MREKIYNWCVINRVKICYTIAWLNVLGGISLLYGGQDTNGWLQIFLGSVIALDTRTNL